MLIRLMRDPGAEDYMDLQVGLSDGDARFTAKYLPTQLPGMNKSLANWLKTAIRVAMIRLMRDPGAEDYMDLQVGLSDGDARFTAKYLPTQLPGMNKSLANWLKTAIRSGHVEQGYFQWQGSLNRGAAAEAHVMNLYFKVRDRRPGWPS